LLKNLRIESACAATLTQTQTQPIITSRRPAPPALQASSRFPREARRSNSARQRSQRTVLLWKMPACHGVPRSVNHRTPKPNGMRPHVQVWVVMRLYGAVQIARLRLLAAKRLKRHGNLQCALAYRRSSRAVKICNIEPLSRVFSIPLA